MSDLLTSLRHAAAHAHTGTIGVSIEDLNRINNERASLRQQIETLREALESDAAGRTVPELLRVAAHDMYQRGDGPLADCLRLKAEEIAAALSATAPAGERT